MKTKNIALKKYTDNNVIPPKANQVGTHILTSLGLKTGGIKSHLDNHNK